jgi:hypothetical protein
MQHLVLELVSIPAYPLSGDGIDPHPRYSMSEHGVYRYEWWRSKNASSFVLIASKDHSKKWQLKYYNPKLSQPFWATIWSLSEAEQQSGALGQSGISVDRTNTWKSLFRTSEDMKQSSQLTSRVSL